MNAQHGMTGVIITSKIEIDLEGNKSAEFYAYRNGALEGKLIVDSSDGLGFLLKSIYTDMLPKEQRISGLGTVLLQVAAKIAKAFNDDKILLAAVKSPAEAHLGPFYAKFGFSSEYGENLSALLDALGNPSVNMEASPDELDHATGTYLSDKGWTFGKWKRS